MTIGEADFDYVLDAVAYEAGETVVEPVKPQAIVQMENDTPAAGDEPASVPDENPPVVVEAPETALPTDTAEQPTPPPVKENTTAHKNFRRFQELFPEIVSGQYEYLRLEAGEAYYPLVIHHKYGSHYCIVNPKKLSRDDFISYGTATAEMLDFLTEVLRFGLSICVTGSTGSGKTTLMSWILSTIPNEKRIFTIENGCREFDLVKEDAEGNVINNVVHTVTRFSDDPKQNYDQERLLEFALTCNPDIVCVGEMKSAEAFAAQEAARTGHAVITTTHANSCKATYYRMVTLCTQKYDMGDKTLYNLVTEAFPIVLFVKKLEDNSRRVMEITECELLEDGTRQLHTLYRYHVSETSIEDGKVKVHGEFQKVSSISASLQKRLLENGMPPRLLERIAGGGVKPDTGKEETA